MIRVCGSYSEPLDRSITVAERPGPRQVHLMLGDGKLVIDYRL